MSDKTETVEQIADDVLESRYSMQKFSILGDTGHLTTLCEIKGMIIAAITDALEQQKAELRKHEWNLNGYCDICGNHRDAGHDADCWLAALLKGETGK